MKSHKDRNSLLVGIVVVLALFAAMIVMQRRMKEAKAKMVEPAPDELLVDVEIVAPEPELEPPPPEEQKQEEVKQEDPPKEEPPKEEVKQEEPPKEEPQKEEVKQEEPPKDEVKQEDPPKEEVKQEETPKEEPQKDEVKQEEPPKEEAKPEPEPAKAEPEPAPEAAEEEDDGSFPAIWGAYSKTMGFKEYAKEMERRGAVFFYFNKSKNFWESFSVTRDGEKKRFFVNEIGRTFAQPKLVTDVKEYGPYIQGMPSDTEVFLTRPVRLETKWRDRITAALRAKGIVASRLTSMRADYKKQGGKLYMVVNSVTYRKDGKVENVSITIELP